MTEQEAAVDYGGKARAVTSMPPNAAAGGQSRAGEAGANLTAVLAGKPEPEQFVIEQANIAMRTLVDYESQYKMQARDIQRRILALADFIQERLGDFAR